MALKLSLKKNTLLNTTFLTSDGTPLYTVKTSSKQNDSKEKQLTTIITRKGDSGKDVQVGTIEWPTIGRGGSHPTVVVGTRVLELCKTGVYTSSEVFQAKDEQYYEWQIRKCRPQLVHQGSGSQAPIATFVDSTSRPSLFSAKVHSASLFVPPEGLSLLDEIIVTFVYFENKWREKERAKANASSHSSKIGAMGIASGIF
ncbi:hypothetical protein SERLA73DRAFT_141845 [Serpula lacrymans var. lacrymans S7.3]|uniref:DUF6593 domain-containing protein n=2 Tax=Serpula lacrymans var. lacrymans TaxID=341189 RepID=F8Q5H3_SERL3|nr:uncharacterized protein SERLADRAFT_397608 [Serpula lacrymans var. lacrymans S7.9]EGN96444.1 hypothetical protein SERLA73DRAFT_141845 [Serpula lacrymans var. lacrymans S7.3]EGO21992.1 hypothetical protein SERLADRAFT_397608 [Serpula lacrymans var. lacrymans S7.9]